MKVLAKKTQILTWKCPICEVENTIFLIKGEQLPDELQCSFCNHESDLINW